MQLFGLGSLALLLPVAIWGYRLLGHRPLGRERLRVCVAVGTVLGAAFACACRVGPTGRCRPGRAASSVTPCCDLPDCPRRAAFGIDRPSCAAIVLGIAALIAFAGAAGFIWRDRADKEAMTRRRRGRRRRRMTKMAWISLGLLYPRRFQSRARLGFCSGAARSAARRRAAKSRRSAASSRVSTAGRIRAQAEAEEEEEDTTRRAPRRPQTQAAPAAKPARRSFGGYALPSLNC